ncbi:MAG: ABC transporter ATP-binding protein [Candidatus Omnitrophica bacterium]|nr:ABC transporter ATP-binding protein [Candidatus Omnitrophota bacterium]
MQREILKAEQLYKRYGTTIAVNNVSFTVRAREIVGLLGPNGAGKTTTINMILGVLAPTRGTVSVNGLDIARHRSKVLSRTNFAAVYAPLPGNLTVTQNLHIYAMLYGIKDPRTRIDELIEQCDLKDIRTRKCGVLSSGEQTRVSLAKAFLNDPDLLLLDEPTASLDPSVANTIRTQLREFVTKRGCGVLWTSHNMHEVAAVCDRVLFLSHGKILLKGDPKTLPQEHGTANLEELFIKVAREPLSVEEGT